MGLLVEGRWVDRWYDTKSTDGRFVRQESRFRNWVTADGRPGPTGEGGFAAEPGRYHLYVSLVCPWAHRTLIMRALKRLDPVITVSVVDPFMGEQGRFFGETPGATPDTVLGTHYLHEVYIRADPAFSGRVTVPVLWDRQRQTIVNNESAEIIRMLNAAFGAYTSVEDDFYPADLAPEIDRVNARIYDAVNNGVYKAGFATSQTVYEEAFQALFACLDELDERLGAQRYLIGSRLTEADIRLFTTLIRFDPVYVGHFKCNLRRIADYRHLGGYLRELYQMPEIRQTVDFVHIKRHYYESHPTINPTRIVPAGPDLSGLEAPHGRDALPG